MAPLKETLAEWRRDPSALETFFTEDERTRLDKARSSVAKKGRTVAYVVDENPFAKAGGIFAVATHLPPALRKAGDETILISPFHRNLATTPSYQDLEFIGEIVVAFARNEVKAELFQYVDKLGNRWVLVQS